MALRSNTASMIEVQGSGEHTRPARPACGVRPPRRTGWYPNVPVKRKVARTRDAGRLKISSAGRRRVTPGTGVLPEISLARPELSVRQLPSVAG